MSVVAEAHDADAHDDAETRSDALSPVALAAPLAPAATAPDEPSRIFRGRDEDDWVRRMSERPALRVLGHFSSTMHVYHLDLGDGIEVSFQPEQAGLESYWRREITAYHLARVLGIAHRVPPTVGRRVPFSLLAPYAHGAGLVVDARGMVVGSASVWMPVLHGTYLYRARSRRVWGEWLNPEGVIPGHRRERARQLSEVLVFDFLSANHDRWNPGNINTDENHDLVFRDNDGGFHPTVINGRGHPEVVRRLPRALYASLQRATPDALRASVARDPMAGEIQLVAPSVYEGYDRRRLALIAQIRASLHHFGERAVLAWP